MHIFHFFLTESLAPSHLANEYRWSFLTDNKQQGHDVTSLYNDIKAIT